MNKAHVSSPPRPRPKPRRPPARQPRQRRAKQTVEAILDAVTRVLARSGPAGLTTNRIAEAAGVSIGSLYQYFRDKRAILAAVRDRHVGQMVDTVEHLLTGRPRSRFDQTLRRLFGAMVAAHARDRQLYELLLLELPPDGGPDPTHDRRFENALRSALRTRGSQHRRLDLRRVIFVLRPLLESLAHAVALRRPAGLSVTAATTEAARALGSYLSSYGISVAAKEN